MIQYLILNGADTSIKTNKGETASQLVSSEDALKLLGCNQQEIKELLRIAKAKNSQLPVIPHYLEHPTFPYTTIEELDSIAGHDHTPNTTPGSYTTVSHTHIDSSDMPVNSTAMNSAHSGPISVGTGSGLLVKVRESGSEDEDFIEVDVPSLTYQSLLKACAYELGREWHQICKIRKLPDVLVRKDSDVQRMTDGQKLEVVLSPMS